MSEIVQDQIVVSSFGFCSTKPGFFDRFYEIFLASDSRIPEHFIKTDLNKQKTLLKDGITFLLLYAEGSKFAEAEVKKLGRSHDRQHLNINPLFYAFWVDSLMKTVKEFDPKFTKDTESRWRAVLKKGIDVMVSMHSA